MVWSTLLAVLAAIPPVIVATEVVSPDLYTYYGCVASTPKAFPHVIAHAPAAGLSISACQEACSYYGRFVAFGSQQCRCSVEGPFSGSPVSFQLLDSERCSEPCVEGDLSQGVCGGDVGTGAWSLWVRGDTGSRELKRRTDATADDSCDEGEGSGLGSTGGLNPTAPTPSTVYGTATSTFFVTSTPDATSSPLSVVQPPVTSTMPVTVPTGAASHAGVGVLGVALGLGAAVLVV